MTSATKAATDRWIETFNQYEKDLKKIEGMFVKQIPYGILNNLGEKLNTVWSNYQRSAEKIIPNSTNAKQFIYNIGNTQSNLRLNELLKMDKTSQGFIISNFFTQLSSLAVERSQADQNISQGWLRDLDQETMQGLSQRIEESPVDWRLLADGLGFSNIDCRKFPSPKMMLDQWLKINPTTTLYRLFFEANRLNMKAVCSYLNAIPLEGTSKIIVSDKDHILNFNLEHRYITKYQLERLDEIAREKDLDILWRNVASEFALRDKGVSDMDLLWKCSNDQLQNLLYRFKKDEKLKSIAEQFEEEQQSGIFQNKSPGGITHAEIIHLGGYLSRANFDKDPKYRRVQKMYLGMWDRGSIDMNVISDYVFPNMRFGSPLSFTKFLLIYWQDPKLGANLDLDAFCHKIMEILEHAKDQYGQKALIYSPALEGFKKTYHEIKPWRSYDPMLAAQNIEQDAEKVSEEINTVAQKKLEELNVSKQEEIQECGICMENLKNVALVPCGHLGYCLTCIQKLKEQMCPTCKQPIQQVLKIFKT